MLTLSPNPNPTPRKRETAKWETVKWETAKWEDMGQVTLCTPGGGGALRAIFLVDIFFTKLDYNPTLNTSNHTMPSLTS